LRFLIGLRLVMTRILHAVSVVLALLALPSASFAQANASAIPDLVRSGQRLSIVDDAGRQVEGRIRSITKDAIGVSFRGTTVDLPLERIVRIERPDGIRNGALIGLGFGVATGIVGGLCDPQGRGRRAWFVPISALGNGVIWMAFGTGIDALVNNRRTIYQRGEGPKARVTPGIGRGAGGAALSLTW
jgi:hypothetical protein